MPSSVDFKKLSLKNGEVLKKELILSELDLLYDYKTSENLIFEIEITRDDNSYLADGTIRGKLETHCFRCLKVITVDCNISCAFLLSPDGNNKKDTFVQKDINEVLCLKDYVFDFKDVVEEVVNLSLPLRVLCSENCRGLCPYCGNNLNEHEECSCSKDIIDPRMAVLKKLLTGNEEV